MRIDRHPRRAFTLVELLLALAILGILAALTIIAINPNRQFSDAKDAKRKSDIKAILDGVYQYQIDANQLPKYDNAEDAIVATARYICSHSDSNTCNFLQFAYLHSLSGSYIATVPSDPDNDAQFHTSYQIWRDANGRITVSAPLGDDGNGIRLTR